MRLLARLRDDIRTAQRQDPAARSSVEIALVYSGLHAVWMYRVTSRLWRRQPFVGSRLLARIFSQLTRSATGVEIHPGARIGQRLFIDHGMGVVIGETAVIGDDVLIYHGVTLGGRGVGLAGRRHPTLGDGVVVGAGAAILGAITVGDDARVGANSVVTRDVEPGTTVAGAPARPI
ncbi:serine acetyltransferase [Frondihabitans sp. PAMC 28766]|uniref:serine O-acetyltransferase n=1 Tax=Frondihabitans sp. PAMC 28766 TaxID=1795630 RepID=UPI00078BEDE6|nr:serine O-acetyltransferase [Frondihabitans sp. PAMC 28766]AMM22074.1 serine acetyltransferase [Frondihabitans sp. PAMC 28766]